MKRIAKTMLGVTLLEIMLVLAIAAMIIVMSIRYYQSANANQQVNSAIEQVQAIAAAYDSLAQQAGGFSQVTSSSVTALLPAGSRNLPWGGTITANGTGGTLSVTFSTAAPTTLCGLMQAKYKNNQSFSMTDCNGVTYTSGGGST